MEELTQNQNVHLQEPILLRIYVCSTKSAPSMATVGTYRYQCYLSLSLYIYIYIYIRMYVYTHTHTHTHTHSQKENIYLFIEGKHTTEKNVGITKEP